MRPQLAGEAGAAHSFDITAGLLVFAVLLGILLAPLALNWLARAAWKAKFKSEPPFDILSVAAIYVAALLGLLGMFAIPAFKTLFDAFGADLPWTTRLLMHNSFLLLIPGILLLVLLYVLRRNPRRETYFGAILAGEVVLLLLCVVGLYYAPIFDYGQAA